MILITVTVTAAGERFDAVRTALIEESAEIISSAVSRLGRGELSVEKKLHTYIVPERDLPLCEYEEEIFIKIEDDYGPSRKTDEIVHDMQRHCPKLMACTFTLWRPGIVERGRVAIEDMYRYRPNR